ncbi:MAG: NHL repeat-containing protein, partial [Desulfobulbales bacterium]|nr:NHL repeat-containing protein [Desulfobulbales bacterium]
MNCKILLSAAAIAVAAFLTVPVQPVSAETIAIDQIGGLRSPTRIAVSVSGLIYVADHKNGSVAVFDAAGNKTDTLEGFKAPLGLAVLETPPTGKCFAYNLDRRNNGKSKKCSVVTGRNYLFVGDEGDGSVQVFIDGEKNIELGNGSGEFIKPNGIAVTSDLTAYVVDSKANEVRVYDKTGTLQTTFGGAGFNFPTDISLNETAGELYVSDFFNKRIRVYDLGGGWLRDIEA